MFIDRFIQRVGGFPMRIFLGMVIAFLILAMPTTVLAQPCEPTIDCNANGVADSCDITQNVSDDCNRT